VTQEKTEAAQLVLPGRSWMATTYSHSRLSAFELL